MTLYLLVTQALTATMFYKTDFVAKKVWLYLRIKTSLYFMVDGVRLKYVAGEKDH